MDKEGINRGSAINLRKIQALLKQLSQPALFCECRNPPLVFTPGHPASGMQESELQTNMT